MSELFDLTKTLCDLPGTSGRERAVTDAIEKIVREYTSDITRDPLGNLIVRAKGARRSKKTIMLAAHTDEVGFMVSGIDDSGLLSLVGVGGLYGHTLAGCQLTLPRSGLHGVLGLAPIHLRKENHDAVPKLDSMYLDIGASSREQAEKYVRLGDCVVFDKQLCKMGDGYMLGKAIDDRLGCAIMLSLLKKGLPCDATLAFTVQEELGLRGARTAAFAIKPYTAIVLDVGGGADNAGFEGPAKIAMQDAGPIISFMDGATVYDAELYENAGRIADENGIPHQTKTRASGGTDAGAIHTTGCGARVLGLSVCGRNIHTEASSVSIADAENTLALTRLCMEYLADVQ